VLWVASNTDATIPTERGQQPGAGALIAFLERATRRQPDVVAGKPERALHQESVERVHAKAPLIVGDRLDTDIEGASKAGTPSLLVLTGVTSPEDLLQADAEHRPTYLGEDLRALLRPAPEVRRDGSAACCGAWRCLVRDEQLHWERVGEATDGDGLDALRAACVVAWEHIDAGGTLAVDQVPRQAEEGAGRGT
jgi:hypothetical protein